jgi:uncharacterized LabA/DUF88 family protein
MMFVDGENLTIRAQKLAWKQKIDLSDQSCFPVYKKDTYFWPPGWSLNNLWWGSMRHHQDRPQRCYYYTSARGDPPAVDEVHDKLATVGFSPVAIHTRRRQRNSKGVDISLTKDMLVHAFLNNYDVAVLVAGDGDYRPVVEEVKRLGKWVILVFFGEDDGLNPDLRRTADEYKALDLFCGVNRSPRKLTAPPPKFHITIDVDASLNQRLERLARLRSVEGTIEDEAFRAITRHVEEEERKQGLPPLPTS